MDKKHLIDIFKLFKEFIRIFLFKIAQAAFLIRKYRVKKKNQVKKVFKEEK